MTITELKRTIEHVEASLHALPPGSIRAERFAYLCGLRDALDYINNGKVPCMDLLHRKEHAPVELAPQAVTEQTYVAKVFREFLCQLFDNRAPQGAAASALDALDRLERGRIDADG